MHSEQSAQGAPQPKSHSRRAACAGPSLSLLLLLPLLLLQSCLTLSARGLKPARPLCPRNSPGQNTGVGSLSLLQRISPTQGSKPRLHCRRVLYHLSPPQEARSVSPATFKAAHSTASWQGRRRQRSFLLLQADGFPIRQILELRLPRGGHT